MKILVVSSCTGKQKFNPPNLLRPADFGSPERLNRRWRELRRFETPAAQMYRGSGHLHMINGVKDLRHTFGRGIIDVRMISPGYGLLNEEDPVVPYDYSFRGQRQETIRQRSQQLRIRPALEDLLPSYDLAFFLLYKDYITACMLPFRVLNPVKQIFFVASSLKRTIPVDRRYIHAVRAGMALIDQLAGANKYNLKGVVFESLCAAACAQGLRVLEEVKRDPQKILEFIR